MKKKIIIASVAALAANTIAHAADPIVYDDSAAEIQGFTWSGFYLGAQGGYAMAEDTRVFYDYGPGGKLPETYYGYDVEPDGWFGGLHLGYNHQFANNLVLGAETDINWGGVSDNGIYDEGGVDAGVGFGEFDMDWFGSTRIRLGYALDRWMPFATAGVAYGAFDFDDFNNDGSLYSSGEGNFIGWTAGLGSEYALTDKISIRGEYRYTDYGSETFVANFPGGGGDDPKTLELQTHDFRFGASYRF